ncbi:hypothetical protein [Bradyrhizobium sp. STM 3562]
MMAEISSIGANFMSKGGIKRDEFAAECSKSAFVPIRAAIAAFL